MGGDNQRSRHRSGRHQKRKLSHEEAHLWETVTRDITPIIQRKNNLLSTVADPKLMDTRSSTSSVVPERSVTIPPPKRPQKELHTATGLAAVKKGDKTPGRNMPVSVFQRGDPRTEERVRRGRQPIDATLDLHGLTQLEARTRLERFLSQGQQMGFRCVLVITGKGGSPTTRQHPRDPLAVMGGNIEGRGILRTRFRQWVDEPGFRDRITRVAQAKPNHGGGGAFYVFLKKLR